VKLNYERVSLNKMESVREGGGRERERERGIPGGPDLSLILSPSLFLFLSLFAVFLVSEVERVASLDAE